MAFACDAVQPLALDPRALESPQRITEMLLYKRQFGLYRDLDVGQRSFLAAIESHAGENPAASLLVHQATSAINGIGDHAQKRFWILWSHGAE